jgi:hypothetical protein
MTVRLHFIQGVSMAVHLDRLIFQNRTEITNDIEAAQVPIKIASIISLILKYIFNLHRLFYLK